MVEEIVKKKAKAYMHMHKNLDIQCFKCLSISLDYELYLRMYTINEPILMIFEES